MKSKSVSTRPASLQPLPLAVYLTGAVGSTFLVSAPQAEAAVTSVTFGFGSVLNTADYTGIRATTPFLGGMYTTSKFTNDNPHISFGYVLGSIFPRGGAYHQAEISSFQGTPQFFASGTVIGNGLNGSIGEAYFSSNSSILNIPSDQLNKNIAFKTSGDYWGWANVSWDATAKALTINSAYIESDYGPITVGDIGAVPEPSSALLALAGLGTAALRRRRKQAA
jgi:hypothetical protein